MEAGNFWASVENLKKPAFGHKKSPIVII